MTASWAAATAASQATVLRRSPCAAKPAAVTTAVSTTAGTACARKLSPIATPMSTASRQRADATRAWISQAAPKKNCLGDARREGPGGITASVPGSADRAVEDDEDGRAHRGRGRAGEQPARSQEEAERREEIEPRPRLQPEAGQFGRAGKLVEERAKGGNERRVVAPFARVDRVAEPVAVEDALDVADVAEKIRVGRHLQPRDRADAVKGAKREQAGEHHPWQPSGGRCDRASMDRRRLRTPARRCPSCLVSGSAGRGHRRQG